MAAHKLRFFSGYVFNDHNLTVTFRVHDADSYADHVFNLVQDTAVENVEVPVFDLCRRRHD